MERGASSNGGRTDLKNQNTADIAEITKMTMEKIARRHRRRPLSCDTTVTYRDMTSKSYGWLLPGWIAEERRVPRGRLYKVINHDPATLVKIDCDILSSKHKLSI